MTLFIERRKGGDRRSGEDQRVNPRLDLSHRRRRKNSDRRDNSRSKVDDFYALQNAVKHKTTHLYGQH